MTMYSRSGTENLRANHRDFVGGAPDMPKGSGEPAKGTANLRAQEHLDTNSWRGPNTENDPRPSGVRVFRDGVV